MKLREMTFDDKLAYQHFYNQIGHPGLSRTMNNLETTLCFSCDSLIISLQIFNWEVTNLGVFNAIHKQKRTLPIVMALCKHYKFRKITFFSEKPFRYEFIVKKVGGEIVPKIEGTTYVFNEEQVEKLWELLGKQSIFIEK